MKLALAALSLGLSAAATLCALASVSGLPAVASCFLLVCLSAAMLYVQNQHNRAIKAVTAAATELVERGTTTFPPDVPEFSGLLAALATLQERMTRELELVRRSNVMRKELVGNVSHDLRTPLTAIRGFLETLVGHHNTLSPAERDDFLRTALRSAEALQSLIDDLFDISRFETKEFRAAKQQFSLLELAEDLSFIFGEKAGRKGVSFEKLLTHGLAPVCADPSMINRALSNLLDNAIAYTPPGGTVTLMVEKSDRGVAVEVRDTGTGIASEDLPHIFDRYYRASTAQLGGSGLGLAIVKHILELHDGTIAVRSTLGVGSVFRVELTT